MKVYIGIKYHEDYSNKIIVDRISSILEKKGYETICIVRDIAMIGSSKYDPYELMKLTFEKNDICDLVMKYNLKKLTIRCIIIPQIQKYFI